MTRSLSRTNQRDSQLSFEQFLIFKIDEKFYTFLVIGKIGSTDCRTKLTTDKRTNRITSKILGGKVEICEKHLEIYKIFRIQSTIFATAFFCTK